MMRRWGRWAAAIGLVLVGVLSWAGWRWWDVRRSRDAMAQVDEAMRAGRFAVAARDLSALLDRGLQADRAAYLLGVCEKARGRTREADAAWARIPPDSPFGGRAVAARMDMLIEQGRLGDAERFIEREAEARGSDGSALRILLVPTLVQEDRHEEALRLIERRWWSLDAKGEGASEQAINLARLHMELRWNLPPTDSLRDYFERVSQLVPDDDRIWLGRANLAIRAGSYDDAARWIDACLRRHPDDPSIWRARLDWAMKTNRPDDARDALKRLPAGSASRAEVRRLSTWFATSCRDFERERRELASLVAAAPEDFAALERLEDLERRGSAGSTHRRRTEIERDQDRYRALYRRNQPSRDAEEMARLADRLGQPFEAIVFLTAAIAEEPGRDDLRAARHRLNEVGHDPPADEGRSLFDRLRLDSSGERPATISGPA